MNTEYYLNYAASSLFSTTAHTPPTFYIGVSTTTPTTSGTGYTEPSTSAGYARMKISSFTTPSKGVIKNPNNIVFPTSTGRWGTITHLVIFDSQTVGEGNLLMFCEIPQPRLMVAGQTLTILKNSLILDTQNPSHNQWGVI